MGMLKYEADCPICGESLKDFQSKSAGCNLETITPDKVNYFYTKCENCNTWINFNVICDTYHVEVEYDR